MISFKGATASLREILYWILTATLMMTFISCSKAGDGSSGGNNNLQSDNPYEKQTFDLFQAKCTTCHTSYNVPVNLIDTKDLIAKGLIVPGYPDQSPLYAKQVGTNLMPPGSPLSDDEKLLIKNWILMIPVPVLAPTPAPTGFQLTSSTDTSLTVSWVSGGGTTANYYVAVAEGSTAAKCDSAPPAITDTSFTKTGLSPNTMYTFSLCAADALNALSAQVSISAQTKQVAPPPPPILPPVPTGFQLTSSTTTSLTVTWVSGGGTTAKYYVAVAQWATAPKCDSAPPAVTGTSFTKTGLSPNTMYTFSLCAADALNALSPQVSISASTQQVVPPTPPPAPTGFQLTSSTTTSLTVSWVSGGGTTANYYVAVAQGSTAPKCDSAPPAVTGTSFTKTGLSANTTYTFSLCAADAANLLSAQVSIAAQTQQVVPPTPPPAPTGFKLTSSTTTSLTVSWVSGGGTTANYYVAVAQGSTAPKCDSAPPAVTGTSFTKTGLSPNTTYTFSLCAADALNALSAQVSISAQTQQVAPPPPPPAPTGFKLTSSTTTSLTVSWVSGGGTTANYYVAVAQGSTAPKCDSAPPAVTGTSFTKTGLSANTTYTFSLCAADAANLLSAQVSISAQTQQVAPSNATYTYLNQNLFKPKCSTCHGSSGGYDLSTYSKIISTKAVLPGNAAGSAAYEAIDAGRMPLGGSVSAALKQNLFDWIQAGALNN